MRKTLLLMGMAGALASPTLASAQPLFPGSCWGHRVAGTVLGAGGGAAIGAALAAGVSVTPWAWAAAGVGALIGHAIGVHSCRNHWRQAYYYGYYGPHHLSPPEPYAAYHPVHEYYAEGYDYYRPVHHHYHYHHHTVQYAYARSPRG